MSTGKLRFLTLVKPVLCVLPEVAQPDRKIPFKVRRYADAVVRATTRSHAGACGAEILSGMRVSGCFVLQWFRVAVLLSLAGEDSLDVDHTIHLFGLLPNPALRMQD